MLSLQIHSVVWKSYKSHKTDLQTKMLKVHSHKYHVNLNCQVCRVISLSSCQELNYIMVSPLLYEKRFQVLTRDGD